MNCEFYILLICNLLCPVLYSMNICLHSFANPKLFLNMAFDIAEKLMLKLCSDKIRMKIYNLFFFLAIPTSCRSSYARGQTHATAGTHAASVAT